MMQPILKWVGGKQSIMHEIHKVIPGRVDDYYEPFLGGGAVYLHLRDHVKGGAYLSDSNGALMAFYHAILEYTGEVLDEFEALVSFSDRDTFYEVRDEYNRLASMDGNIVQKAAMFLYINSCGFNGLWRVNAKGRCNVPYGGDSRKVKDRAAILDVVRVMGRARQVYQADFRSIDYPSFGDLVYCDPPYTGTFDAYTSAGWTAEDDMALKAKCLDWLNNGANVVVSTADDTIWQADFNIVTIESASKIKSKARTEYIAYA